MKNLIDKIYERHPIAWQVFITSAWVGSMIALLIFVLSTTSFGG